MPRLSRDDMDVLAATALLAQGAAHRVASPVVRSAGGVDVDDALLAKIRGTP